MKRICGFHYSTKREEERLWLVEEGFVPAFELKTETVFSQCNGYVGVRASHPFSVLGESRGTFLCGAFDRAYPDEVTELANCPDTTWVELEIEGEKIYPDRTPMLSCERKLDILTGELCVAYTFRLADGETVEVENRRFASAADVHVFAQAFAIRFSGSSGKEVRIKTGINGQQTNSGVSHFREMYARVYDKKYMEIRGELEESGVRVLSAINVRTGIAAKKEFGLGRRSIFETCIVQPDEEGRILLEKPVVFSQTEEGDSTDGCRAYVARACEKGYPGLFEEHCQAMRLWWKTVNIQINGVSGEEEAAIKFAQYHIHGMTPWHTNECSIAAKGLTGEGYKGHVFWDTELFIFPSLLYTYPKEARRLLEFRYRGLDGARQKAADYGFRGAMFPWEAARSGEEETPLYAALNIHTGKANKVWSGIKEYHVTADIIYAVEQYFEVTADQDFMDRYGYEMAFESARFWVSCAQRKESAGRLEILDVIGPDEYTEHVDNNAYTNYMAAWCVKTACKYLDDIKERRPEIYTRLEQKIQLQHEREVWKSFLEELYIPQPGEDLIIPQDDTFLSKPCLDDIDKYKNAWEKQCILKDFSRDEVVGMQVLKQADVVMLFNLFPSCFPEKTVKNNVDFYERRTVHDSSLSYCVHAQVCASIGEMEQAWDFFRKSLVVDINENPYDSRDGIHAASLGGIWNCLIFGFAGVRCQDRKLHIAPHLPEKWSKMSFTLKIAGGEVWLEIASEQIRVRMTREFNTKITVEVGGAEFSLVGGRELKIRLEREKVK